jgi:hypothetical protein
LAAQDPADLVATVLELVLDRVAASCAAALEAAQLSAQLSCGAGRRRVGPCGVDQPIAGD